MRAFPVVLCDLRRHNAFGIGVESYGWPVAGMVEMKKQDYKRLAAELQGFLEERFDDVRVEIGDDIHWRGTNVVITSPNFAGLLPEQRYHHVVRAIPPDFYEAHLRRGIVWFELAPDEPAKSYMKLPRSEDIAKQEDEIAELLAEKNFVGRMVAALGPHPADASGDDFKVAKRVLKEARLAPDDITRACLFFMHRGAFCDVQLMKDVLPKMTEATADD